MPSLFFVHSNHLSGMNVAIFDLLAEDQLPRAETRARATYITDGSMAAYPMICRNKVTANESSYTKQPLVAAEGQRIANNAIDAMEDSITAAWEPSKVMKTRHLDHWLYLS